MDPSISSLIFTYYLCLFFIILRTPLASHPLTHARPASAGLRGSGRFVPRRGSGTMPKRPSKPFVGVPLRRPLSFSFYPFLYGLREMTHVHIFTLNHPMRG